MRKIKPTMRHIAVITFLLLIISCKERKGENLIDNYLDNSIITDETNVPLDSNQLYFPVKLFKNRFTPLDVDSFTVAWYSMHLKAMHEPLLFNKRVSNEVFRFTWLRTFDNPVAIRIEKQNDKIVLSWKLCNGAGGYDPGEMTISDQKTIDKESWETFIKLVNRAHFWQMETEETNLGIDGEQWILEGREEKRYHVVDRWSPSKGDYFNCCNYLIQKIDIDSSKLTAIKYKVDSVKMTDYGPVYILADEYPKFGKEEADIFDFISENIKTFLPPIKESINEKVIATFVVFEDGSIEDIKILRGVRPDIDSSCIRFLKNMPRWIPGKVNGKPIKTQMAIPIRIGQD